MTSPVQLKFSEKYDEEHARQYFLKHQAGLSRRLSHQRDEQMARKALKVAGDPSLVLDLPCGAGRFWPLLAQKSGRVIIGADNSSDMLATACKYQDPAIVKNVQPLQTSAFDIALPDGAVDSVFCMRLLHHIGDAEHRMTLLKEFHRVTRETVILSMWVDGNFKSWKRKRHEKVRSATDARGGYQNRFVIPRATAEAEFIAAGFSIEERIDFIPLYAMWRVYVLRKR